MRHASIAESHARFQKIHLFSAIKTFQCNLGLAASECQIAPPWAEYGILFKPPTARALNRQQARALAHLRWRAYKHPTTPLIPDGRPGPFSEGQSLS